MDEETQIQNGELRVQGHAGSHWKSGGHIAGAAISGQPGPTTRRRGQVQSSGGLCGLPYLAGLWAPHLPGELRQVHQGPEFWCPQLDRRTNSPCPTEQSRGLSEMREKDALSCPSPEWLLCSLSLSESSPDHFQPPTSHSQLRAYIFPELARTQRHVNVLPLASFLTSLGLSVLICKMGRIIPTSQDFWGFEGDNTGKAPPTTASLWHLLVSPQPSLDSHLLNSQEASEKLWLSSWGHILIRNPGQLKPGISPGPAGRLKQFRKAELGGVFSSLPCLFLTYFALIFPFATNHVRVPGSVISTLNVANCSA